MNTSPELYKRHRPTTFKEVYGQTDALRMLFQFTKTATLPHSILFTGPSGCGKTTLARILKLKLECNDSDFCEMNCADFRGIDMVRDIRSRMSLAPIAGKCRIWLIDEAHQLSKDGQNAFLKILEDTPSHVYFFIATTDPVKLLPTIRTRCTEVKLKPLTPEAMTKMLMLITLRENLTFSEEVIARIIDYSEGSARRALVLLNQIAGVEGTENQMSALQTGNHQAEAIQLARALLDPRTPWATTAKLLKTIEEEPEALRHMVLGYASSVLLGGGRMAERAFLLIDIFKNPFYDSKKPGLVAACYAVAKAR